MSTLDAIACREPAVEAVGCRPMEMLLFKQDTYLRARTCEKFDKFNEQVVVRIIIIIIIITSCEACSGAAAICPRQLQVVT